MNVQATTPFGQRPVSACLVEQITRADRAPQVPHADKWALFDDLCVARTAFGVTDRDLAVLHALLGFHPGKTLSDNDQLIVFPSNAALSRRVHGMAESTLRRHLAALVGAGLIRRHDSPNGKRYAARGLDGEVTRAFGFDLRPLLEIGADIAEQAALARAQALALKRLREEVVILRRDATKLLAYLSDDQPGLCLDAESDALMLMHRVLRRKADAEDLEQARAQLQAILRTLKAYLKTEEMHGNAAHSGRHLTDSNTDSCESELIQEKDKGEGPNIPLPLVLKACPDILPYADSPPRHWHELVALAAYVRAMMGISADGWDKACRAMGPEVAAICVAGILQKIGGIKSPGGYLRALTTKAETGAFSPGPMIMALLRSQD